jgi:hypothetical protein
MNNFQGWIPTPQNEIDAIDRMLGRLHGSPEFSDVAPHLRGFGADVELATPYKSVIHFHAAAFEDEAQTTGDCTSHGGRNASDISRAVEIHQKGELEEWVARGATEIIYSYRGHTGQGMNVGRSIDWLTKFGLMVRKDYGFINLSRYNSSIGASLGRTGPTKQMREEAAKHPVQYYARIRNVEQARAALAAGYGITCGSGYGNNGTRDKYGIARWSGGWNHCMAWGGFWNWKDLYFLVLNSWGKWNRGGMPEWGPIPGGSFLIPSGDAKRMIQTGECWAVGDFKGFPKKQLPDYGTGDFL